MTTGRGATADCTCWTTSISDTDEAVAACPVHRKAGRKATPAEPLPIHRTEAGFPDCSTCDGGGCLDCTDPA